MNSVQPYCLPDLRELTDVERGLLQHVVASLAPIRSGEIDGLRVVARCGCGACPTIIFGGKSESQPLPAMPFNELGTLFGRNREGVLVGVTLLERQGQLSELEAWSPEGGDVSCWPSPNMLSNGYGNSDA